MGNPAGVRRDFVGLEQRRREAAELLRQGVHQAEVARRVRAHRQSVSRWAQQLEEGGLRGLKRAGRAGRKARLRQEDLRRIERGLKRGPQPLGYESGLWTSARVAQVIELLTQLLRHLPGKLLIVWDGLRSHRSRMVWDFVRQQRGRLWLEFLPAYAPELNPVEYLWAHWKHHELPNFCPDSYGELSYHARQALRRMRRRPMLVCAFWQQAELFPL